MLARRSPSTPVPRPHGIPHHRMNHETSLLAELEARQDEVLAQLDQLNAHVEEVLRSVRDAGLLPAPLAAER